MSAALLISFALAAGTAEPAQATPRSPLVPTEQRVTSVKLDTYHRTTKVVRKRSQGKDFASFRAEPHLLTPGTVVVFEVKSVAKTGELLRWQCVAEQDVAECLGSGVKVRYLPDDDEIVLTARVEPRVVLDTAVASR